MLGDRVYKKTFETSISIIISGWSPQFNTIDRSLT